MDDVFDALWESDQSARINDLGDQVAELRRRHERTHWDLEKVKELADENLELRLRLGLLMRLLIAKGVFSAEEYAGLIAQTNRGLDV